MNNPLMVFSTVFGLLIAAVTAPEKAAQSRQSGFKGNSRDGAQGFNAGGNAVETPLRVYLPEVE